MADSIIDHGPAGDAAYQAVINRALPLRGLEARFDCWRARFALAAVEWLVPRLRAWERNRTLFFPSGIMPASFPLTPFPEREDRDIHRPRS